MTLRRLRFSRLLVALLVAVTWSLPRPAFAATEQLKLFVPLAFFVCVAVVVTLVMVGHHWHTVQRHQTLRAMVEKGMEIPPRLLGETGPSNPRKDLRRGILLVCTGVGIGLFLFFAEGGQEAMVGLVPVFIGLGYLIVYGLERKLDRNLESSGEGSQASLP